MKNGNGMEIGNRHGVEVEMAWEHNMEMEIVNGHGNLDDENGPENLAWDRNVAWTWELDTET